MRTSWVLLASTICYLVNYHFEFGLGIVSGVVRVRRSFPQDDIPKRLSVSTSFITLIFSLDLIYNNLIPHILVRNAPFCCNERRQMSVKHINS